MAEMKDQNCTNCIFSIAGQELFRGGRDEDSRIWICRRFPPVFTRNKGSGVGPSDGDEHWCQPAVVSCDWCGEWKPKP